MKIFHSKTFISLSMLLAQPIFAADHQITEQPPLDLPRVVEPRAVLQEKEVLPNTLQEEEDAAKARLEEAQKRLKEKEDAKQYLAQHPRELEIVLGELIRMGNAEGLAELLPLYRPVEDKDQSLIDWAEGIIAMSQGDFDKAVDIFRYINSLLPDIKLLRFHMAMALFSNQEYIAAKDQFEKLRSEITSEADLEVVESYLKAIQARHEWSFYGSFTLLNDNNLNNVPPKGTQFIGPDGSSSISTSEPEKGRGFSLGIGADKKWPINDRYYVTTQINGQGSFYLNNRGYNDLTTRLGLGVGYNHKQIELEGVPFYQKRWYAGGSRSDKSLKSYSNNLGLRLEAGYWFNQKYKYQGALEISKDEYYKPYNYMDGHTFFLSNGLLIRRGQRQYWFLGFDYSQKSAQDRSSAYTRPGVRVTWGQDWGKGISTRTNIGYATRHYRAKDFFNIKQKTRELNISNSIWHRNIHYFGITPRLVWSYKNNRSNNPFYEYKGHTFYVDFSKSF